MAPDRTILHIVKNFQGGAYPDPLPFKIMSCTLLSLSYAPGVCVCVRVCVWLLNKFSVISLPFQITF